MASQRWIRCAALSATLVAFSAATVSQQPSATELTVVHRFEIPDGHAWGSVAIQIVAGGWRLGSLDGPAASEAQLRAVLRSIARLEIGGRCTGWVSGPTAYPCGFSLRAIDLAGAVGDLYAAVVLDDRSVAAASPPEDVEAAESQASSPRSPRLDEERFVALRAPSAYLGDKSDALGGTLRFEIRTVSNALVPSRFDRGSGLVILRSRVVGQPS